MKKRKNQGAEPANGEGDRTEAAAGSRGSGDEPSNPERSSTTTRSDVADTSPGLPVAATDDLEGAQPVPGDDDVTNRIRLSAPDDTASDPADDFEVGAKPDVSADLGSTSSSIDETSAEQPPSAEGAASDDDPGAAAPLPAVDGSRLESILESLLFAADRPLTLGELKRFLGERDGKRVTEALENLRARRADAGIQLLSVAGGWQLRTHPGNGAWVAKLVAGRPTRLSRAMMETLAIVAYRQPITRPEIDEIRGVDCGPVLRTLLDRSLVRVLGKKEEVGRPMLYGTTPEFLKIFSLRDLAELPTLREFHELGADDRAKVDATTTDGTTPAVSDAMESPPTSTLSGAPGLAPAASALPDVDPDEEDSLIEALERAAEAAGRATRSATEPQSVDEETGGATASPPSATGDR